MSKSIAVVVCVLAAATGNHRVMAQCQFLATDVSPNVFGRHLNPAASYTNITGNVADGDVLTFDSTGLFGGPFAYEFDTDSSVTPGNIAVTLTAVDNVTAARAIVDTVNANVLLPFVARTVPLGSSQYVSMVWKTLSGYGAVVANPVDANNTISPGAGSVFIYQASGNDWFQISGTDLNPGAPHITVKLRLGLTEIPCTIVTPRTATKLTCRINLALSATPFPAGIYDLVLSRATIPCPDFVLPGAVTIVDNLLKDPTFQTNVLGNPGTILWNVGLNTAWLPATWYTNNLADTVNPMNPNSAIYGVVKRGDKFHPYQEPPNQARLEAPRQLPFPTATLEAAAGVGDNEWLTLRWDPANGIGMGRHQTWQYIDLNLPETSFVTLSGVWLGGTTLPSTLTFGFEIRDVDENGTILAQTPAQQTIDRFDWTPFSFTMTLPGGPHRVAFVIYGDNSADADAGLHIDDLLLHVGAQFWPDLDNDSDVDMDDFAGWQLCYTGAGGTVAPACASLDRDTDGDLDESDFNAWRACGTGANVPMPATNIPPGCDL